MSKIIYDIRPKWSKRFEKEIEESEKSGWAEDNDVNTFIIKWKNLK